MAKTKDPKAERHQVILAEILKEEDNKYCADCGMKGPRWASWNLGVFLCIRCAGIHRNLGVHISRVKSVNLDSWTPEQIEAIQQGGNGKAADKYEASLPDNYQRPNTSDSAMENFIRNKYERKMYVSKDKSKETVATTSKQKKEPKKVTELPKDTKPKKTQIKGIPRPVGSPKASKSSSMSEIDKKAASPIVDLMSDAPPGGSSLLSTHQLTQQHSRSAQDIDLLTGSSSSQRNQTQPNANKQDLFMFGEQQQQQQQQMPKLGANDIMSLYNTAPAQSQYSAYTGNPVNAALYQQQQIAALKMAQQYQQQQMQVFAVQQQMANLKMQQGQPMMMNGGMPMQPQAQPPMPPGQTLNPDLW